MMEIRLRYLIQVAMLAALTAVGALISVPLGPVPFTLQSLMVPLSGAILGPAGGFFSQLIYLLLGFVGLPVFANFSSGIGALAQPSGGFLLSFPLAAAVAGWLTGALENRGRVRFWPLFGAMIAADLVVFAIGVPWLAWVIGPAKGHGFSLLLGLKIGLLPFVLSDLAKLAAAAGLAVRLRAVVGAPTRHAALGLHGQEIGRSG